MAVACPHLDQVQLRELPASVDRCEDCLHSGAKWVHLQICLTCGHLGRCDDSLGQHASAHAAAASHPIIRSLEPGDKWCWCFADQLTYVLPEVQGRTRIPPSPLPSGAG